MDRDEAVRQIREGLGFRASTATLPDGQTLESFIYKRLNAAQDEFQTGKSLPRWLIVEDATISLLSGNPTVALPTGFLRLHEDDRIRYFPTGVTSPFYIPRKDMDDALAVWAEADAAGPQVYARRKSSLYFFPTPDRNYSLTWSYYAGGTDLAGSNTSTNVWLVNAPQLIIGEAGMKTAMALRDKDAVQIFSDIRTTAMRSVYADIYEEELEGGPLVLSGEG